MFVGNLYLYILRKLYCSCLAFLRFDGGWLTYDRFKLLARPKRIAPVPAECH